VDELFPSGQLVTSPAQEQAKIRFLREQSLENMLGNIEGVISANVVIADTAGDDNDSDMTPSASVLIKYSPEVNLRALNTQLKNLIYNALPGVNQDRIALVTQSVNYHFVDGGNHSATDISPEPAMRLASQEKTVAQTVSKLNTAPVKKKTLPFILPKGKSEAGKPAHARDAGHGK
jgi:type III secretion protein J